MMSERYKITVEIDNLTEPQSLAIQDMLRLWMELAGVGASRFTAFFADGDGDFRPQIVVDGKPPERCLAGHTDDKHRWRDGGDVYYIDFDEIAWWLRSERENIPSLHLMRAAKEKR